MRRWASSACASWLGPNLATVKILTLARARAVAPAAGTNLVADGRSTGAIWADWAAARSNKGPIIRDMLTRMEGHGYPLVKHCSKMERLPKRLTPLPARMGFASGRRLPRAAGRMSRCFFHECGRGGTGRRATLRSLWAKARGSSSLLDRTRKAVKSRAFPDCPQGTVRRLFSRGPCPNRFAAVTKSSQTTYG